MGIFHHGIKKLTKAILHTKKISNFVKTLLNLWQTKEITQQPTNVG